MSRHTMGLYCLLLLGLVAPVAFAAEAAAGFVDTEPPVITLDLEEIVESQFERTCDVLTDDAKSCPEPEAHAFDHHEGVIDVVKHVKAVMISRPKSDPKQVDRTMASLDYDLRASYVLTYDAGA